MSELHDFMKDLPIELYVKIMYKSGICNPEAKLIKDMNNSLIIPFESVIWMHGDNTYIKHLTNMCVLQNVAYKDFIEFIYLIG